MNKARLHARSPAEPPPRLVPACIWVMGKNLEFGQVLGETVLLFGRPAMELRGHNLLDCVPEQSRAWWRKAAERALAGEAVILPQVAGGLARGPVLLFSLSSGPAGGVVAAGIEVPRRDGADLSKMLHDEVGQRLSAAGLELDLLRMELADIAPPAVQRIDRVQAALESVMQRIRELSYPAQPTLIGAVLTEEADAANCSPGR